MKFLIVIAFVATIAAAVQAVSLTEEQRLKAIEHIGVCKAQEKITDEQIAKLKAGDFGDVGDDVKCFANCFLERAGIVKDGVLQEAVVLEKFGLTVGEDKAKQVLDLCRSEVGANKCDTSFKLLACLKRNKAVLVD